MWVDHQEPGAPQFKRTIEVGLTKEGEAFAAGGSASDLPKCIITGGASTMTVSYQGKSYPLCCSGCRDEFNDNPAKYVQKAALAGARRGRGRRHETRLRERRQGRRLLRRPGGRPSPKARPLPKPATPRAKARADRPDPAPLPGPKPGKDAARAASLLRLGQNLDKQGKTAAARSYYQQVVKDYAETPEAKTAAARLGRSRSPVHPLSPGRRCPKGRMRGFGSRHLPEDGPGGRIPHPAVGHLSGGEGEITGFLPRQGPRRPG